MAAPSSRLLRPGYAAAEPLTSERVARGQVAEAWLRLRRNRGAVVAAAVLGALVLAALLAPWIAPYDPIEPEPPAALQGPSAAHWMGTDALGRDVFSRIVHGTRVSLLEGVIAVLLAGGVGITLGLLAGYYGGWLDVTIMRSVDVLLAFPSILLALVVLAVLGPNLLNAMLAVGVAWIPNYARLTYGTVLSVKQNQYVEAARVVGGSDLQIMLRYILPNVAGPLIVLASLCMAFAILAAASLSFIGLGAQPPTPEWGAMAADGRAYLRRAWWVSTFPGLAVMVTVLAINLLGDGLRDALDPRMKERR
jgi:ABC-type dipeptide/oligopeptide/nickel transport system permease subunit